MLPNFNPFILAQFLVKIGWGCLDTTHPLPKFPSRPCVPIWQGTFSKCSWANFSLLNKPPLTMDVCASQEVCHRSTPGIAVPCCSPDRRQSIVFNNRLIIGLMLIDVEDNANNHRHRKHLSARFQFDPSSCQPCPCNASLLQIAHLLALVNELPRHVMPTMPMQRQPFANCM